VKTRINADIVVVGGGIVGTSVMYHLQNILPDARIILLEKEGRIAYHQSGRNSGVIHSGIYYAPGSLKARMCVEGRRQLVSFLEKYKLPYRISGKLIVATSDDELQYLNTIYRRGLDNGVEDIHILDGNQIRDVEPYVRGVQAIWVRCAGVTDFSRVADAFTKVAMEIQPDSRVITNAKVIHVETKYNRKIIHTKEFEVDCRFAVFCGGLHADTLARMDGIYTKMVLLPFRGEFYKLTDEASYMIKSMVYPVPDPRYPFLGIHFTRMVDDTVECGPNALPSFAREKYGRNIFDFADFMKIITSLPAIKFYIKNMDYGIRELRRHFFRNVFLKVVNRMVPDIKPHHIKYLRCGIRAIMITPEGRIYEDFYIEKGERSIHVISAPSPAATSSMAIGNYIATMVKNML